MKQLIIYFLFICSALLQAQGTETQTIQKHLKHKDMIFVPNLDPEDCIFKEYDGILYVLAKNEEAGSDNSKALISLRDVSNNNSIQFKSFRNELILNLVKGYNFRIHDFEINDNCLVFSVSNYLYLFQKEGDSFKYMKQIKLKNAPDYLKLKDNKLNMLTCGLHNGEYEGVFQTLNLEDESISNTYSLYVPIADRFLYFQPKQVANFFEDSYMQSEIIQPVIYFKNGEGVDTVKFAGDEWVAMPDSILQKLNKNYSNTSDRSPKMVIDNIRKYTKKYSFVHKLFSLSDGKVLVIWSVPGTRALYDYRYTIIQKNDKNYNIIADNMKNTTANIEGSLSDFNGLMPFSINIGVSQNYLIDILPIPFKLEGRHFKLPFLELNKEIDQYHLRSDITGFSINITELKND